MKLEGCSPPSRRGNFENNKKREKGLNGERCFLFLNIITEINQD
jgi:hypothetical protein